MGSKYSTHSFPVTDYGTSSSEPWKRLSGCQQGLGTHHLATWNSRFVCPEGISIGHSCRGRPWFCDVRRVLMEHIFSEGNHMNPFGMGHCTEPAWSMNSVCSFLKLRSRAGGNTSLHCEQECSSCAWAVRSLCCSRVWSHCLCFIVRRPEYHLSPGCHASDLELGLEGLSEVSSVGPWNCPGPGILQPRMLLWARQAKKPGEDCGKLKTGFLHLRPSNTRSYEFSANRDFQGLKSDL